MRWSLRTFINGGLFSFSGWCYSSLLGAYRAFVTDPNRAVVLNLGRRTCGRFTFGARRLRA